MHLLGILAWCVEENFARVSSEKSIPAVVAADFALPEHGRTQGRQAHRHGPHPGEFCTLWPGHQPLKGWQTLWTRRRAA